MLPCDFSAGLLACTGCSGEDYAIPGRNALVLQTANPKEFVGLYRLLRDEPGGVSAMRRAGRTTARQYAWPEVIRRNLMPRLQIERAPGEPPLPSSVGNRHLDDIGSTDVVERILHRRQAEETEA